MPYVPANVPEVFDSAFFAEEYNRIAGAVNFQEAIGQLGFNPDNAPFPVQAVTGTPIILQQWDTRGPNESISDGPVLTDPRVHAVNQIAVKEAGIFQVSFTLGYDHDQGAELRFEVYKNGLRTFIIADVAAFQVLTNSGCSATGMMTIESGDILEIRASSPTLSDINMTSGTFSVFKLRDLRTRFS